MSFIGGLFGASGNSGAGMGQGTVVDTASPGQATDLYNQSQDSIRQQQNFVNALNAQGGLGNQASVYNQQQGLANQLQQQANGQGPNPAQAQLANNTGQNIAGQAALMAGQRGTQANTGLLARQIGQQGAGIQQQAAGQAAVLGAQQQLAAQQQLQQQQGMLGNMANAQVGQQAQGIGNLNQFTQSEQQNVLNSIAQRNATRAGLQSNINNANAGIQAKNQAGQFGMAGQLFNSGSNMLSGIGGAGGVDVAGAVGSGAGAVGTGLGEGAGAVGAGAEAAGPAAAVLAAHGGMIDGPSSMAGRHLKGSSERNYSRGGHVDGHAKVKGDSYSNDTVHALLSPGEIVVPRSEVSKGPDAAAKFVAAIMARHGKAK